MSIVATDFAVSSGGAGLFRINVDAGALFGGVYDGDGSGTGIPAEGAGTRVARGRTVGEPETGVHDLALALDRWLCHVERARAVHGDVAGCRRQIDDRQVAARTHERRATRS